MTSRGGLGRFRRSVAAVVTVLLTAVLVPSVSAQADAGVRRPAVQHTDKTVKGHRLKTTPRTPDPATRRKAPPKASWPKPGSAEVRLVSGRAGAVRAGELPVWVGTPAEPAKAALPQSLPQRVKVRVLDHTAARKTGAAGPMFTVARTDSATTTGRVGVHVDYSGFVNDFGGSYGSRLRLVRLPACARSAPVTCSPSPRPG